MSEQRDRKASEFSHKASLVVQWLRIRLPRQRTQVPSLVREDLTCPRALSPYTRATEPEHSRAHAPKVETTPCLPHLEHALVQP